MDFFSKIPRHNQMDVLKKLDFSDFVKFKKCSKETMEISKNFRHGLHLKIEHIHFLGNSCVVNNWKKIELNRILEEPVHLKTATLHLNEVSNEEFEILDKFCRTTKMKVNKLKLMFENESWMVDKLLKLLNPFSLNTWWQPYSLLASLEELNRVKRVEIDRAQTTEDLLRLKHSHIEINLMDTEPVVVNKFVKQWLNGEREVERVAFRDRFLLGWIDGVFQDLEPTLLWPREPHNSSSQLDSAEIYTLKRNDGKNLCIVSSSDSFIAEEYDNITEIEKWIPECQ